MASRPDEFNIPLDANELPFANVERANNPDAAAAARARIAALPIPAEHWVTAVPTANPQTLVTRREQFVSSVPVAEVAKSKPRLPHKLRPLISAVLIFFALLILFKLPVIVNQVQYITARPSTVPTTLPVAGSVIPSEPTITIPKINVHAPTVYEPSMVEANIQKALESGIVHYGNTPVPGQNGNSVFFGHSSNDWWEPGNYKFVFVLLDKLAIGDRFSIDYQSKRYTYEVTSTKVVVPTDLSVLNPTSGPTVTLITCSPPGTSLKRLVVTARQIDPDPSATVVAIATPNKLSGTSSLPGAAPGLVSQAGSAISGIFHGITSLFSGTKPSPTPIPTPSSGELPAIK